MVAVGVNDKAAIASCACAVRAMEVNVAFAARVGVDVSLGTCVCVGRTVAVEVKVGGTVSVTVGV